MRVFRWTFFLFTQSPLRWNHGSSDGHFLLLLLLLLFLLHPTNFLGNSRQSRLLSLLSPSPSISCSVFVRENCPLLSGELSTDSRQSSDSYLLLLLLTTSFLWKQVCTGLYSRRILYQLYKLHK